MLVGRLIWYHSQASLTFGKISLRAVQAVFVRSEPVERPARCDPARSTTTWSSTTRTTTNAKVRFTWMAVVRALMMVPPEHGALVRRSRPLLVMHKVATRFVLSDGSYL